MRGDGPTEKYKDGKTPQNGAQGEREKEGGRERKKGQRTTGYGRSQSCAHFFSRPNPKTLLCPPKINYPPYSKNETAMNKEEPRRTVPENAASVLPLVRDHSFSPFLSLSLSLSLVVVVVVRYAPLNWKVNDFRLIIDRDLTLSLFIKMAIVTIVTRILTRESRVLRSLYREENGSTGYRDFN